MTERKLLGESEDDSSGYDWGFARVYQEGDKFYIIRDSGCSCDGPADTYAPECAVVGPTDNLGDLLTEILSASSHYKTERRVKEALLDAIKNVNDETYTLTKKALGL